MPIKNPNAKPVEAALVYSHGGPKFVEWHQSRSATRRVVVAAYGAGSLNFTGLTGSNSYYFNVWVSTISGEGYTSYQSGSYYVYGVVSSGAQSYAFIQGMNRDGSVAELSMKRQRPLRLRLQARTRAAAADTNHNARPFINWSKPKNMGSFVQTSWKSECISAITTPGIGTPFKRYASVIRISLMLKLPMKF